MFIPSGCKDIQIQKFVAKTQVFNSINLLCSAVQVSLVSFCKKKIDRIRTFCSVLTFIGSTQTVLYTCQFIKNVAWKLRITLIV